MSLDVKARRVHLINLWNKVFGKNVEYTEGCEETIGEGIVNYIEKAQERDIQLSPMYFETVTWYSGDPTDPKSRRKRYITKQQAEKVATIVSIISLSPSLDAVASWQEMSSVSYNMGLQMQVCEAAEALLEGEDIFFSDHEKAEILKSSKKLRSHLSEKRNRLLQISIRNLHLQQEEHLKKKDGEDSS